MDHRLKLSDRLTQGEQCIVQVMLTFMNELRVELGLDPLTETHVIDHIRRYERLAQVEKEAQP